MLLSLLQATGGSAFGGILPILLILVVFYVFMILPQMRKQKTQKKFREELTKGYKIVTIGGIVGKIVEITDNGFIMESEGTRMRIVKDSVSMEASQALNKPEGEAKK